MTKMRLPTEEFIRRFLIHVLPFGFHRIRHSSFLANAIRRDRIAKIRRLLNADPTWCRHRVKEPATPPTNHMRNSLAPNAAAQWLSFRPFCAVKHPNAAHRHGRMPHDTTSKPGPFLRSSRNT
ncbi:transposase [Rhodobacteraceae bacterium M382]|nr:transposase [Rhodobacteraceae bacterium M382]